jgi:hypothetical protein
MKQVLRNKNQNDRNDQRWGTRFSMNSEHRKNGRSRQEKKKKKKKKNTL